ACKTAASFPEMGESFDSSLAPAAHSSIQPFSPVTEPFIAASTSGFLVVFKPAGMNSVSLGKSNAPDKDLVSWLGSKFPDHAESIRLQGQTPLRESGLDRNREALSASRFVRELGMLSRLDRETSGLVLFATSLESFGRALEAQKAGRIGKLYRLRVGQLETERRGDPLPGSLPPRIEPQALLDFVSALSTANGAMSVAGRANGRVGTFINFDITSRFRSFGARGARVACIQPEVSGKTHKKPITAIHTTHFSIRGISGSFGKAPSEGSSLKPAIIELDASIVSGFRHQIRAHMAWAGFPIIGDAVYGGYPASRLFLESYGVELESEGLSYYYNLY
ncbi:MAG: hypothetical protein LLF89_03460, partial [Spirochaetaceae bacterium]|nr:hypothetical protein [Spirochaetaceae bacterium]